MAETLEDLINKLKKYEENGVAKLYYSLNRKAWEMADMLNSINLKNVDMASKSDATFDRVFKLLEKSEGIATAVKALGETAGITGDEEKDVRNIKQRTTPETIANVFGDNKGQEV